MEERKEQLTGKIKAIASPARIFVIIVAIILLAAGTMSMIGAFLVQMKGLPESGSVLHTLVAGKNKQSAAGVLVNSALLIWIEANVLFEVGRMLGKISEDGIPFKPLGKSFRKSGILLMIGQFAPSLIGNAVTGVLCFLSSDPLSWEFRFDVHLDLLVVAIIVLILSSIFEYGALLQQESDETL